LSSRSDIKHLSQTTNNRAPPWPSALFYVSHLDTPRYL